MFFHVLLMGGGEFIPFILNESTKNAVSLFLSLFFSLGKIVQNLIFSRIAGTIPGSIYLFADQRSLILVHLFLSLPGFRIRILTLYNISLCPNRFEQKKNCILAAYIFNILYWRKYAKYEYECLLTNMFLD
jgi:ABC-type dipeptide/oligopeptide/nickel transport system permease subunit